MIFADIILDISHEKLDRTFQYAVPMELEEKVREGMVVSVPFGNGNHQRKGYVVSLSKEAAFDLSRMKYVSNICSEEDTVESRMILLAS